MNPAPLTRAPSLQDAPRVLSAPEGASPVVSHIPITMLRLSFQALRNQASSPRPAESQAELPIRVACRPDGAFEVIDGFKRLQRWSDKEHELVPAVIEHSRTVPELKLLLLRANAPPRTTTPMDEARVIQSLVHQDGLSLTAAARLLGRRKPWATRRYALATRLSPEAQAKADRRALGPTCAYALSALSECDQRAILRSAERHSLRDRDTLLLVSAWRASDSDAERAALASDPLPVVRPAADHPQCKHVTLCFFSTLFQAASFDRSHSLIFPTAAVTVKPLFVSR